MTIRTSLSCVAAFAASILFSSSAASASSPATVAPIAFMVSAAPVLDPPAPNWWELLEDCDCDIPPFETPPLFPLPPLSEWDDPKYKLTPQHILRPDIYQCMEDAWEQYKQDVQNAMPAQLPAQNPCGVACGELLDAWRAYIAAVAQCALL